MSVLSAISIATIKKELEDCADDISLHSWQLSQLDEENLSFTIGMVSPIDHEEYLLSVEFNDYPEIPLLLDFIDPVTKTKGTRKAYPVTKDQLFFINHPIICHPCSRKAYANYSNIHSEWVLIGWQKNQATGSLTSLRSIFTAIYTRIASDKYYNGRMEKVQNTV